MSQKGFLYTIEKKEVANTSYEAISKVAGESVDLSLTSGDGMAI
jgi:hypothetical protein